MNAIADADFSFTAAAAARVRALAEAEGDAGLALRVEVSGGGCSGFQYGFALEREARPDDKVYQAHGITVLVDEASLDLLRGSQLDYVEDLMAAAFRISNPNATATCGCGTSFAV